MVEPGKRGCGSGNPQKSNLIYLEKKQFDYSESSVRYTKNKVVVPGQAWFLPTICCLQLVARSVRV